MKTKTIHIGLEFLFGPIQKLYIDSNGNEITGISVIDNDSLTQSLDKEINNLWCSLYSKDENSPSGMYFNKIREKELAPKLLEMISQLIVRLNQINDGSFVIHDMITNYLKSLI